MPTVCLAMGPTDVTKNRSPMVKLIEGLFETKKS